MVQDTQFVRQTKDLGNIFQMVGAFKYDDSKSTDQTKVYHGSATILSIRDYNDDSLVTKCISQGCSYTLNFILTVTSTTKTLEIDSFYAGGVGLNQLILLDKVTIYYESNKVIKALPNPVEISGVNKIIIPLNDQMKME